MSSSRKQHHQTKSCSLLTQHVGGARPEARPPRPRHWWYQVFLGLKNNEGRVMRMAAVTRSHRPYSRSSCGSPFATIWGVNLVLGLFLAVRSSVSLWGGLLWCHSHLWLLRISLYVRSVLLWTGSDGLTHSGVPLPSTRTLVSLLLQCFIIMACPYPTELQWKWFMCCLLSLGPAWDECELDYRLDWWQHEGFPSSCSSPHHTWTHLAFHKG